MNRQANVNPSLNVLDFGTQLVDLLQVLNDLLELLVQAWLALRLEVAYHDADLAHVLDRALQVLLKFLKRVKGATARGHDLK